jgi:hypothetical protein
MATKNAKRHDKTGRCFQSQRDVTALAGGVNHRYVPNESAKAWRADTNRVVVLVPAFQAYVSGWRLLPVVHTTG